MGVLDHNSLKGSRMVVEFDDRGPLKSKFNCCIGCVAFISFRAVETRFTFIANLT